MDLKKFNRHNKKKLEITQFRICSSTCASLEEVPAPEFNDLPDSFVEYDEFHEEVESSANDSGGRELQSSSLIPE